MFYENATELVKTNYKVECKMKHISLQVTGILTK